MATASKAALSAATLHGLITEALEAAGYKAGNVDDVTATLFIDPGRSDLYIAFGEQGICIHPDGTVSCKVDGHWED